MNKYNNNYFNAYGYNITLIFNGNLKNGERNGKGIEYFKNGDYPLFEGEYLNGKNGMELLKNIIILIV